MKTFLLLLFALGCAVEMNAQNLVPNPSFEEHIGCPTTLFDLEFTSWDAFNCTPDYFNSCSGNMGFNNLLGYQIAHTGDAYAGFHTFVTEQPYWREHLGVPLIQPLQIGQTYYVSFYVSRGFIQPALDMASNKIGALFSTVLYDDTLNPSPIHNFAHVYEDSIITDITNWTYLHWTFVADSAYQYLIIGNFFDDPHTDTIMMNQFSHAAYYFLDDVCVATDSSGCFIKSGIENLPHQSQLQISPNPATSTLTITNPYGTKHLTLTNTLGQIVFQQQENFSPQKTITIDVSHFPAGIYFIQLKDETQVQVQQVVIQH